MYDIYNVVTKEIRDSADDLYYISVVFNLIDDRFLVIRKNGAVLDEFWDCV